MDGSCLRMDLVYGWILFMDGSCLWMDLVQAIDPPWLFLKSYLQLLGNYFYSHLSQFANKCPVIFKNESLCLISDHGII